MFLGFCFKYKREGIEKNIIILNNTGESRDDSEYTYNWMWDNEQVLTHSNCYIEHSNCLIGAGIVVLNTKVFLWIT